jgi:hypothetical protein
MSTALPLGALVLVRPANGSSPLVGHVSNITTPTYTISYHTTPSSLEENVPEARITHIWDKSDPSNVQPGMSALCMFEEDNEYYPGNIGPLNKSTGSGSGKSFTFLFDDGDTIPNATSNMLQSVELPAAAAAYSSLPSDSPPLEIGMLGLCLYGDEYFPGKIHSFNADNTVVFYFDDGDQEDAAPRHHLKDMVFPPHHPVMRKLLDEAADSDKNNAAPSPYGDEYGDDFDEPDASPVSRPSPSPTRPLTQQQPGLNGYNEDGDDDNYDDELLKTSLPEQYSNLHPLLIPPDPNALSTTPYDRLNALALEYIPLLTTYNTSNPSTSASSNVLKSLTALQLRSLPLATLLSGGLDSPTRDSVSEQIELALNYVRDDLHVQAATHAQAALHSLNSLELFPETPESIKNNPLQVTGRQNATALLHMFTSISTLHAASPTSISFKQLNNLVDSPSTTPSLFQALKSAYGSSPSLSYDDLLTSLRRQRSFQSTVASVEALLRPKHLASLKHSIAASDTPESLSAPEPSALIHKLREDYATHCYIEHSSLLTSLSSRIAEGASRVPFEEVLSLFSLSAIVTDPALDISKQRVEALTILGRALVGQGKISAGIEKLKAAKKETNDKEREDDLTTCDVLAAYGNALIAEWHAHQASERSKNSKKSLMSKALEFSNDTPANLDMSLEMKEDQVMELAVSPKPTKPRRMARMTDDGETQWTLQMKENLFVNPPSPKTNLALADELLTHCHDVLESKFGTNHVSVAKAACAVAFQAVLVDHFEDAKSFLDKALGVYRKVEPDGVGLGVASVSVSLGRLKLRKASGEDEMDEGLADIKFGADYYKNTGNAKGYTLFTEMAKIHEDRSGCVDYDMVECLENAVQCSVACYGENSLMTLKTLKLLGEKCDAGGDFDRSKQAYKRALQCAEVLHGADDVKCVKIKQRLAIVGVEVPTQDELDAIAKAQQEQLEKEAAELAKERQAKQHKGGEKKIVKKKRRTKDKNEAAESGEGGVVGKEEVEEKKEAGDAATAAADGINPPVVEVKKKKKRKFKKKKKKKVTVEIDLEPEPAPTFTRADLMEAAEQASTALSSIGRNDILELKGFKTPPSSVLKTLLCVCVLFQEKRNWESAKRLMSRADFIQKLEEYDKTYISEKMLLRITSILRDEGMDVSSVRASSQAAGGLCLWVHCITNYASMAANLAPGETPPEERVAKEGEEEEKKKNVVEEEVSPEVIEYTPNPVEMKELKIMKETDAPILDYDKNNAELENGLDQLESARGGYGEGGQDELLDFMISN